ncbi:hypothetical protein D3C87_2135210 [compost metagenome]
MVFGTREDQFEVALEGGVAGDRLGKTGPAGAAFVFVLAVEQRQVAGGADVGARAFLLVERAAVRPFGILFE